MNMGVSHWSGNVAALALAAADTATAISEYDLAAQIRTGEPVVQWQLGALLAATGHAADAATHFKAGIAADSVYARSYLGLAKAEEALGDTASALATYQAFLTRAPRSDTGRPFANARVQALRAGGAPEPRP